VPAQPKAAERKGNSANRESRIRLSRITLVGANRRGKEPRP
jgi:hypothetical protein